MLTGLVMWVLLAEPSDLERARLQFQQMKYEAALKSLAKAITAPGVKREDRAQIYLYTGLCRHQTADEKGAQAAFREALAIDRTLTLPPGVGPKASVTFERARAELPPLPAPEPPPTVAEPRDAAPAPSVTPSALTPTAASPEPSPSVDATAPPPPPAVKRWWPMGLALGVAAVSAGAGAFTGWRAAEERRQADLEPFGSDGARRAQSANTQALVANVLYGLAGAAGLFALIAVFVF